MTKSSQKKSLDQDVAHKGILNPKEPKVVRFS